MSTIGWVNLLHKWAHCWFPPHIPNLPYEGSENQTHLDIMNTTYHHWRRDRPYSRHFVAGYPQITCGCLTWYTHLPFSIQIPWCAVLAAVDICTTIFISDVAWATCQWIPVPCEFVAGTLTMGDKWEARKSQTKLYALPDVDHKISDGTETTWRSALSAIIELIGLLTNYLG